FRMLLVQGAKVRRLPTHLASDPTTPIRPVTASIDGRLLLLSDSSSVYRVTRQGLRQVLAPDDTSRDGALAFASNDFETSGPNFAAANGRLVFAATLIDGVVREGLFARDVRPSR